MPLSVLTGQQIAEHQLLAAIKLWHQRDYLSALTLAGAAEEIQGKLLRKLNYEPPFDQIRREIVEAAKALGDNDPKTDKLVADLLNQTRNELKHYSGEEPLSFDLYADAQEMLERAIASHQLLTGTVLDEAIGFSGN